MNNQFILTACLHKVDVLRYTPAGVAVLDVVLQHESWQEENGLKHQVRFELPAKIIGQNAQVWQYRQGEMVTVTGFLAQRSQRIIRPILRIQHITEYKG
ncbi:primosomal replication protein N [Kingella kingae]|uniref:Primosomal replication protein n=2 Tax=Kingella kingae TaxID=504 RepID=F5S784_KINKI|nr:primosomal replication protein N [Kingella kingae]EGK09403.1 primosomal replication protein [Kingella kingae ATCC 23330]MDK4527883.1 primosomal replication protein N [Kingella kingae]MDK4534231.1 primosomal replication protein N [Kingella kingae]MDK4536648.1 primosomal replication protein N [Kingella kingae]MDK4539096.1 primosomal replication protein N [Kingella kingae]